jgi:nucleoside-specific outer membrane channel protein Tsx
MRAVSVVPFLVSPIGLCWFYASVAWAAEPVPAPAEVPTPVQAPGPTEAPKAAGVPTAAQAPTPAVTPEPAGVPMAVETPKVVVEVPNKKLVDWSVFDFQYLYGFNWDLGPKRRDILTLEHADGWKLGDNYLFVDISHITNQDAATSLYGEWQPRFSLSKIFGVNLNVGPLHDILETNRLAFGGGILAYLAGGAIDLNIPGFTYWHQHFFVRKDIHLTGSTWQTTSEWLVPFEIGSVRFVQDGFVHVIGAEGTSSFNIIAQPQLLLDVGKFGGYEDQLFIGTEVDLRYNEYGIKGQNEVVPQAMVEWKL